MEEQRQAEARRQHRGAAGGGGGGRGGAGAAAQGPHHGGRLSRNGAPRAGNPGHPRRGVAATTPAVATAAPGPASTGGGVGQRRQAAGAAKCRASVSTGVERGGVRPGSGARAESREQRRRFPQGCGEEEAELRSVGAGGGVPSRGSGWRRQRGPAGARPTISCLAAGCPLRPRRRLGLGSGTTGTGRRGQPRRRRERIPPDTLQLGRLLERGGGEGGRRADCPLTGRAGGPPRSGDESRLQSPPSGRCPPAAGRTSASRPREGSRDGGGGSAHAARSFRRRRRCPSRGRPREAAAK
ncbi:uncharacterized protein LOC142426369 [Tenrec ecaudatus]|uniref:uncharacterized protein LOC142426369 n=1 Tax=Tenrec ecaudatus TaxID=94439 RepID=UPI003F59ABF5